MLGPSDIAAVRHLLDERRDHYIVCGLLSSVEIGNDGGSEDYALP